MNRAWTALVALALSPMLILLGLTVLYAANAGGPATTCSGPCDQPTNLAPAAALAGPDGLVDDPTTNGRITRRMLNVYNQAIAAFNGWPWGINCWDRHQWNPTSDHPLGRACDFTVGHIGTFPDSTDRATGWRLANWVRSNATTLGIKYVIFDGLIWSALRGNEGWRPYDGGGIYDPHNPTGGHFDHVHVSVVKN